MLTEKLAIFIFILSSRSSIPDFLHTFYRPTSVVSTRGRFKKVFVVFCCFFLQKSVNYTFLAIKAEFYDVVRGLQRKT